MKITKCRHIPYKNGLLAVITYAMGGLFVCGSFLANVGGWLSVMGALGMVISIFWLISFFMVNYEYLFERKGGGDLCSNKK